MADGLELTARGAADTELISTDDQGRCQKPHPARTPGQNHTVPGGPGRRHRDACHGWSQGASAASAPAGTGPGLGSQGPLSPGAKCDGPRCRSRVPCVSAVAVGPLKRSVGSSRGRFSA